MTIKPPDIPIDTRLSTTRCMVRCISLSDASTLWSAVQNYEFVMGMGWDGADSQDAILQRIKGQIQAWKAGRRFAWTGIDHDVGEPLGGAALGILTDEPEPSTWLLSYWTHPMHRGKGYALEIATAVLAFGFETLNASAVWAGSAVWNASSRRVLEKLRMRKMGRNPRGYTFDGVDVVTDEYLVTQLEWQKRHES